MKTPVFLFIFVNIIFSSSILIPDSHFSDYDFYTAPDGSTIGVSPHDYNLIFPTQSCHNYIVSITNSANIAKTLFSPDPMMCVLTEYQSKLNTVVTAGINQSLLSFSKILNISPVVIDEFYANVSYYNATYSNINMDIVSAKSSAMYIMTVCNSPFTPGKLTTQLVFGADTYVVNK